MSDDKWDKNRLYSGFIWGVFIGSLVAMFRMPHLNLKTRLKRLRESTKEMNTHPGRDVNLCT